MPHSRLHRGDCTLMNPMIVFADVSLNLLAPGNRAKPGWRYGQSSEFSHGSTKAVGSVVRDLAVVQPVIILILKHVAYDTCAIRAE